MIGILDCTRQDLPLLQTEFVHPVRNIVKEAGYEARVFPLDTPALPDDLQAVILTGTALQDHRFLHAGFPCHLLKWEGPILGICAGMQLLSVSFGGELFPCEMIGMIEITVIQDDPVFSGKDRFNAWELHQSGVKVPEECEVLARSDSGVQGFRFRHRPWYGVLFHPEVRNEWVILNFLKTYV